MEYIFSAIISFLGSFTQRVTGFGYGMVAMSFIPYFVDGQGSATALSNVVNLPMSSSVAIKHRKDIKWKIVLPPLLISMVPRVACIFLLKYIGNTATFKIVFGAFLVVLSLYFFFFSEKIHIKPTLGAGLVCGFFSGITDGFFAMGGPPVIIYFLPCFGDDKDSYIASTQAFFALSGVVSLVLRIVSGFFTLDIILMALTGLVGMVTGLFVGGKTYDKLNPKMLRKVVYGFMALSGVIAIFR